MAEPDPERQGPSAKEALEAFNRLMRLMRPADDGMTASQCVFLQSTVGTYLASQVPRAYLEQQARKESEDHA